MTKENGKLESTIDLYVKNWYEGLIKSWRNKTNERRLRTSYDIVAKLAVQAFKEKEGIE